MAARPSEPLLALLRTVAKDKGLNTAALAQSIEVERAHLKHVLAGREPLTVDELIGLAQVLELGPEQLGAVPLPPEDADPDQAAGEPVDPEPSIDDAAAAEAAAQDEEVPSLGVLPDRGIDAGADPIGAAANPYGNHAAQALRLGLALGCDVHLVVDSNLVRDSGVPPQVLQQFKERLPIRLDAAFHRHHDVRFLPEVVQMTLSFDALYTCHFPWASVLQVTIFPLPPEAPEPEDEDEDEDQGPGIHRGHLRLVE